MTRCARLLAAVALSTSLVGCAEASPEADREAQVDAPAQVEIRATEAHPGESTYLVWRTHEDGTFETLWLSPRARGYAIEDRIDGLYLAAGERLWQWHSVERRFNVPTCPAWDSEEELGPRADFVQHVPELRAVGEDVAVSLIQAFVPSDDYVLGEYDDSVMPAGVLGDHLIVDGSSYDYSCGAHGGVTSFQRLIDLRRPERAVDPIDPDRRGALAQQLWPQAESLFGDMRPELFDPIEPQLTAVWPRRSEDHLEVLAQITADTCYACSDGNWSSYTASVQVPLAPGQLPAAFAGKLDLPEPVREFLWHNAVPPRGWGWTTVEPGTAAAAHVAALFAGTPATDA